MTKFSTRAWKSSVGRCDEKDDAWTTHLWIKEVIHLCVFSWALQAAGSEKALLQSRQLNGFSPVWIRMCLLKLPVWVNFFPQSCSKENMPLGFICKNRYRIIGAKIADCAASAEGTGWVYRLSVPAQCTGWVYRLSVPSVYPRLSYSNLKIMMTNMESLPHICVSQSCKALTRTGCSLTRTVFVSPPSRCRSRLLPPAGWPRHLPLHPHLRHHQLPHHRSPQTHPPLLQSSRPAPPPLTQVLSLTCLRPLSHSLWGWKQGHM